MLMANRVVKQEITLNVEITQKLAIYLFVHRKVQEGRIKIPTESS